MLLDYYKAVVQSGVSQEVPPLFVAYGASTVCVSTNGVTWTQVSVPNLGSNGRYSNGIFANDKFVLMTANTYGSNIVLVSSNGYSWSQHTMPLTTSWSAIGYGAGKFVALVGNFVAYSYDGMTWQQATLPASRTWYNVFHNGTRFVASHSNGLARSDDGITWVEYAVPASSVLQLVGSQFVLVPGYQASGYIYVSDDGITWTRYTTNWGGKYNTGMATNGDIFVAFGNYIATSPVLTASTWTGRSGLSSQYITSMAWNGQKFVAAQGHNSGGYDSTKALVSDDGVTWTPSTLPANAEWRVMTNYTPEET